MAYTPTTWATGDTITAAKLNNMEQGIVNLEPYYVEATYNDTKGGFELSDTLADIAAICATGRVCKLTGDINLEIIVGDFDGSYMVFVEEQIRIEPYYTPPLLVLNRYEWDSSESVLIESNINYELTPSSI